jgi:uncharacterized protein (DUF2141 family)
MNRKIIPILCLICFSSTTYSQYRLDIEISRIRNNRGNIMLQLFDGNEKVLYQEKTPIADNKCTFSFPGLSTGKYVIGYYHDENMNGKMERKILIRTSDFGTKQNISSL